ncbi:MAG: hypothetical protein M3Q52_09435 [Pseudomonadota bacterium]|nr:hypothetical protein [Pseudomonadota bacterium]
MEPATGEAKGHTHETNCLNCGCKLVGDYCHCCGQQAHVHRTVGAWWHDFLHSVLQALLIFTSVALTLFLMLLVTVGVFS